ncbi:DNA-3-methyladenine glycosylase [Nocardioides sp.]|uniref:DNA-3-methyladenine glycosylase n=1 Tax=Nocardioides sp. TaxID=35761 RepID=UPI00260299DB|nr:DNA-3-methyladenine glycosylase [Nocardioides sp.]
MTSSAASLRARLALPSPDLAPTLLGAVVTCVADDGVVSVEITEVEAYAGEADPASHAWHGPTPRNAVMFGPPGHLYVYRSHGLHWCLNVVAGVEGTASAVLLRAGRVIEGADLARVRRSHGSPHPVPEARLARGPGCLGQALGVSGALDGADLTAPNSPIRLTLPCTPAAPIASGPRVGVTRAAEVAWRWWVDGDPTVSAYRRSPRAQPPLT